MKTNRALALLGLAAAGTLAYAWLIEPRRIRVTHVALKLPRLPKAFDNYRVVQISDLHLGSWMTPERLRQTAELINLIEPDLIAITGDFVDRRVGVVAERLIDPLRRLRARDGVVAVMGNHDHYNAVEEVRQVLRASDVTDVSNRVLTLRRGDAAFHIAGVDDVARHKDCLDKVLDQLPETGAALLLVHEPDFADLSAPTGRFDVQLSGHTHGGQVRLPLLGPLVLPSYGKRYPAGLYRVERYVGLHQQRPGIDLPAHPPGSPA